MNYNKEVQQMKRDIWKYYQNQKNIEGQKKRIERLYKYLDSIQEDINSPQLNHNLKIDIRGVVYDSVITLGGALPSSSMERNIDQIYSKLEKEYKDIEMEIIQTKILVRQLEKENEIMKYCIGLLKEEYQMILQKKFLEGKSLIQISFEMNMSKSNINRILDCIYLDITRLIDNIKNLEQKVDKS